MNIELTSRFLYELDQILTFIADDNIEASLRLHDQISGVIEEVPSMPYKHRKSIKADDENIRDLIYKGYVVPYRIKEDAIEILGIFSFNEWDMQ